MSANKLKGGYIEHHDNSVLWTTNDGPVKPESPMGQFAEVVWKAGEMMGQTFKVVDDDIQRTGISKAGFVNLEYQDFKVPFGPWPKDRKLKTLGSMIRLAWDEDPEGTPARPTNPVPLGDMVCHANAGISASARLSGWVMYVFNAVLGWDHTQIKVYLAHMRRQMRTEHLLIDHRVVWAQKPEK